MNFLEKIEEIQQKPVQVRKRILVVSVSAVMIIIVGAWLAITSRSLAVNTSPKDLDKNQNSAMTPFSLLGNQFKDFSKNIQDMFKK